MVFNATFNNISDVLYQSILLMEGTGSYREKKSLDKLDHIMNEIQAQMIRH